MLIDDATKQEIRDVARIDTVASSYTDLRPDGAGRLRGLCPIHDERTPSFKVDPGKGTWHCFGCGQGGDAFALVQQVEQVGFLDAARLLAERFNVPLRSSTEQSARSRRAAASRQAVVATADAATRWLLDETPGAAAAREWLTQRKFSRTVWTDWGIGYVPGGGHQIADLAGVEVETAVEAGLMWRSRNNPNRTGDRLSDRVTWRLSDQHGRPLGFAGRALGELVDGKWPADGGGKYSNPPSSPLYDKARILYGLDRARRAILSEHVATVVEGYTDVVANHIARIGTTVATCGTAFTAQHAGLLAELLPADGEIVAMFDGDAAGWKAAWRLFEVCQPLGLRVCVAQLPSGDDPCSLRITQGDQTVLDVWHRRRPLLEVAVRRITGPVDLTSPEDRMMAAAKVRELLRDVTNPVLRNGYADKAASWLRVTRAATGYTEDGLERRTQRPSPTVQEQPPQLPEPFAGQDRLLLDTLWLLCDNPGWRERLLLSEPSLRLRFPNELVEMVDAVLAGDPELAAWQALIGDERFAAAASALAAGYPRPQPADTERVALALSQLELQRLIADLTTELTRSPSDAPVYAEMIRKARAEIQQIALQLTRWSRNRAGRR